MDEQTTKDHIHAHADAVVRGDMDTVIADLSEELQPQAPQLAAGLPMPVTEAEVLSLDFAEDESVAEIRYTGDSVQAYLDAENSVDRPSYTLVDVYGSFKVTENAKLFFSVDNLLDKSYFSAVAGTSSVQDIANGRGRTIMIGATTRF